MSSLIGDAFLLRTLAPHLLRRVMFGKAELQTGQGYMMYSCGFIETFPLCLMVGCFKDAYHSGAVATTVLSQYDIRICKHNHRISQSNVCHNISWHKKFQLAKLRLQETLMAVRTHGYTCTTNRYIYSLTHSTAGRNLAD